MSSKDIFTFKGGVIFSESKYTANAASETVPPSPVMAIPLLQYGNYDARPCVTVGERVLRGQLISEGAGEYPRPVYSSVSGIVKDVVARYDPDVTRYGTDDTRYGTDVTRYDPDVTRYGTDVTRYGTANGATTAVVIESDGEMTAADGFRPHGKKLSDTSPVEIIEMIRKAGVIGNIRNIMPLYAMLERGRESGKLKRLIVNCVECEPYVTSGRRLLLEHPSDVVNGTKILLRALSLPHADLAVDERDVDAVNALRQTCGKNPLFRFRLMKAKYPQGDPGLLVNALTGREINIKKLPEEAGYVVVDAGVCAEVFRVFATGVPPLDRRVTVDGELVREPKNLLVPIGTPVEYVLEHCGGLPRTPCVAADGDPMTRLAFSVKTNDAVVSGISTAVLIFPEEVGKKTEDEIDVSKDVDGCIRCGRCVDHCPMRLIPVDIARNVSAGKMDIAKRSGVMGCIECGVCSYVCPAGISLFRFLRKGKAVAGVGAEKSNTTDKKQGVAVENGKIDGEKEEQ